MTGNHRLYGWMVRLYPRGFRDEFGEALEQHFADLVADRGTRAAWARTGLDLAVTLPRYRLESLMSDRQSHITLVVAISLLVAAGCLSFLTGVGPGMLLIGVAVVLGVAQRSQLSRAIRTPDTDLRRRRLLIGAVLGLVFVVSYTVYMFTIGDHWTARETVLATVGTIAMFGSIAYLVVGLLTPRTGGGQPTAVPTSSPIP